ncbi:uncharacterized protein LOC141916686 [Strix aluco]|uniref:uncharacterized protein LOC141916686 n=1 Tax=Strix aluco TaxID=111821 RepID=UPI003DA3718E
MILQTNSILWRIFSLPPLCFGFEQQNPPRPSAFFFFFFFFNEKKVLLNLKPTHLQEHQQGWVGFWRGSFATELGTFLSLFAGDNHLFLEKQGARGALPVLPGPAARLGRGFCQHQDKPAARPGRSQAASLLRCKGWPRSSSLKPIGRSSRDAFDTREERSPTFTLRDALLIFWPANRGSLALVKVRGEFPDQLTITWTQEWGLYKKKNTSKSRESLVVKELPAGPVLWDPQQKPLTMADPARTILLLLFLLLPADPGLEHNVD